MDDKQLQQMIQEIEAGEKLQAPSYLKGEILAAITEKKAKPAKSRLGKKLELFGYALEVSAVTAAAIALIFMAPIQELAGIRADSNWEADAQTKQKISYAVSNVTEKIVTWGNVLLPNEKEIIKEEE